MGEGSKAGTYAATFAPIKENGSIDENRSVAEAGEELSITVNDAAGKGLKLKTASYPITAADIAAAKAVVNLQIVMEVVPPATVTLNASPETLPGDGVSQSLITATVKDVQGSLLLNQTVTFKITKGGGTISPPTDRRDGTYTATYTTAASVDPVEITASTANGKSASISLKLTKPIKVSPTLSTIIATTPVIADGASTSKITITLLDESRQPVPGKRVKLTASGEGNTLTQPVSPTDAAGRTTTTLASTKAESKRITAMVVDDGIGLADRASVIFQSGPAATVTVVASPNTLSADGTSVSAIGITITDRHGNPVTGEVVSVVASAGRVDSPAKDNGNGTYQSTYTASTAPGMVTLTASTTGGIRGEGKLTLSKCWTHHWRERR
ncbi:Ig-like domain-containing protein [Candidatus Poribacteria bacterium]|nr:Ig-like domain-containing protein [Candidatus Poribacteria bacterium]